MLVTSDTDLAALTIDQINYLLDDAGEDIVVDSAQFVQLNASDEYQYEVTYDSPVANTNVTNHVFIDLDDDDDPRITINDLAEEEDLFADWED